MFFTSATLVVLMLINAPFSSGQHEETDYLTENIVLTMMKHKNFMKKQEGSVNFDDFKRKLALPNLLKDLEFPRSTFECLSQFDPKYYQKYLDALAKPPTGILQGNVQWLGNYDDCMSIPNSHYCDMKNIAVYNHMFHLSTFGVCAPKKCSIYDVTNLLNATANALKKLNITNIDIISVSPVDDVKPTNPLNPTPQISKCFTKRSTYSTGAVVMIVISSLIIGLCVFGTIVDLSFDFIKSCTSQYHIDYTNELSQQQNAEAEINYDEVTSEKKNRLEPFRTFTDTKTNKVLSFFLCFSIIKNTKSIFNTNVPRGAINSINGIRFFSITWVILGHLIGDGVNSDNPTLILNVWLKRFSMQGITNATVSVDTFFVLSGILVSYLSFKRFESYGKLPLFRYYFHRYIRLTPSYLFLIFFMTYLLPYFGDGPSWPAETEPNCKTYWWTNVLYINNLYPESEKVCYGVSWYLANDMQFYIISPIFLWLMYRLKLIGVLLTSSVVLVEYLLANGLLMYYKKATPIIVTTGDSMHPQTDFSFVPYMKYIYFKPWTRIGPYVIGLVCGYILFYKKTISHRYSHLLYLVGWIIAAGLGMAVVYGPYSAVSIKPWSAAETYIYGMFFRLAWVVAVCWVIYACHHGYGSIVGDFLGWKAFIPLSRLTYGVYLIHIYVLAYYFTSSKTTYHLSETTLTFVYIPVIVISYCLSYVVTVCIEYPVFNLERLIFKH